MNKEISKLVKQLALKIEANIKHKIPVGMYAQLEKSVMQLDKPVIERLALQTAETKILDEINTELKLKFKITRDPKWIGQMWVKIRTRHIEGQTWEQDLMQYKDIKKKGSKLPGYSFLLQNLNWQLSGADERTSLLEAKMEFLI